jgi:hypothetical protein
MNMPWNLENIKEKSSSYILSLIDLQMIDNSYGL